MLTIATLKEGDWVDETYLVSSKQLSTAKNGVVYLSLKLADKTGEIDAKLWDNAEETAGRFVRDDFVHIKGIVANYQGSLQIRMKTLEKVSDSAVDLSNFLQASSRSPEEMSRELHATAAAVVNGHLRQLMNAFLQDTEFLRAFQSAPAARTLHHNYIGGLMEHILDLISLCRDIAGHFPGVDQDLLIVGAFLHDIGKVRELGIRKSIEYTTEGRLIGHISLGYEMLVEKIKAISDFPAELAMVLKHIMLSHHGEYEFGSPKRPKIQEAIIIHYLDDLSAKISNFQATLRKENVAEGEWTSFSKMHDRYLYRHAVPGNPDDPGGPENRNAEDVREGPGASRKHREKKRGAKEPEDAEPTNSLPLNI